VGGSGRYAAGSSEGLKSATGSVGSSANCGLGHRHNEGMRRFVSAPSPALEQMLREDLERGIDPLAAEPEPPPGPPIPPEPLIPVAIPPPDWRREEEERERKQARYPAPKQTKSKTPNLDRAKEMRRSIGR
jgi:hypothetical protein